MVKKRILPRLYTQEYICGKIAVQKVKQNKRGRLGVGGEKIGERRAG